MDIDEAPDDEEPEFFLGVYDDMEKKTNTMESTGRSATLPDLLYRGREGKPMKSSRSKRKGVFDASYIGTGNITLIMVIFRGQIHTGFIEVDAVWELVIKPLQRGSSSRATKSPCIFFSE